MDPKSRPNHQRYISVLRRMSPADRLNKSFELSAWTRDLFFAGLRERFPNRTESELRRMYVERILRCRNPNS